jgi:O-antigen ligase/tetratricopeptide (TPR) repeat protein
MAAKKEQGKLKKEFKAQKVSGVGKSVTETDKSKSEKTEVSSERWDFDSVLKVIPFVIYAFLPPLFKYQIEYVWSKISVAYLATALSGIVLVYITLKSKKIYFNFPKTFIPVVLFLFLGSASAIWAYNPYKTQNLAVMIAPGVLAYITLQLFLFQRKEIKVIAFFSAISASIVSGYGFLQVVGVFPMPPDQYGSPNPITTFGLSNFAVEYLLTVFPIISAFAFIEKNIVMRVVFASSSLITFLYMVAAKNRAGWVGLITFIIFFLLIYLAHITRKVPLSRISKYLALGVVGTSIFLFIFFTQTKFGGEMIARFKSFVQVGPGSSVSTRLLAWSGGLEMIKENPIIGVGGGNFEIYSWKYAPRLLDEGTIFTNTRVDKAHNEYLQIFADLGIVGFTIFISIIFIILKLYLDIFSRTREIKKEEDEELFFVATGLFLGILSLLASASFNFSLQWPGSVLMFWLNLGLLELIHSYIFGQKPIEFEINKKFVALLPGLGFFVASLGAPCVDGIPFCTKETGFSQFSCQVNRKICRASIGFFASRNLMLAEIYYRIAQWQKRFRNFDISERYYLASLKHDNPAERTYYDLAYLYLGKSGGALTQRTIDLLEQTIKYVPYFGKGVRELGNMYVQLGQIDKGIGYLLRSTDSNPANIPEAYALVANAYFMKGDYQKAIEYGQKALEEIENSPSWKYYKIPIPDRVFDVNSVRFMAYFAIGASYAQLKDYDSAQKYLELAQSIKPQDMRVLINLSTVYINKGEFDKAEGILNSFEPQDFKEKGAKLFNLASLYAARGDKEKALEYLKAASEVDPTLFDRAFRDKYLKSILKNEN